VEVEEAIWVHRLGRTEGKGGEGVAPASEYLAKDRDRPGRWLWSVEEKDAAVLLLPTSISTASADATVTRSVILATGLGVIICIVNLVTVPNVSSSNPQFLFPSSLLLLLC